MKPRDFKSLVSTDFTTRAVLEQSLATAASADYGGAGRNRTGVRGVAVRYMTTLPPRQIGAEKETRTPDPDLGKVVLYQLSYFRKTHCPCTPRQGCTFYVLGANSQLKDQVSESAETMMPLLSAYR